MASGPTSKRCSACDTNWPNASNYSKCPVCLEPTWEATNETPLSPTESVKRAAELQERIKKYEKFEEFYVEREVKALQSELDSLLC